jgi:hypothetical protein
VNRHVAVALAVSALACVLSVRVDERSLGLAVENAHGATAPAECMHFDKTQTGRSIELEAKSSCDARLECTIDYSVRCENREGKETSQTRRSVRFSIAAGKSETLTLSAEACTQGWTIDDVGWSCRG